MTQPPGLDSHRCPRHGSRPDWPRATRRTGAVVITTFCALLGTTGTVSADPDSQPEATAVPRPAVTDVAHRGASAYAPENTLAAIDEAAARGASVVEVDVQRTADGELVLMHDTTLERTTNAVEVYPDRSTYELREFTLEEVRALDAGSWFDRSYAGEPVPTLREALDRLRAHDLGLLLEVKSPGLYEGIEGDIAGELRADPWWLLPAAPDSPHRLVIQSFDWGSMERSNQLLPRIPHGLLGRVSETEIADYAAWADQINPNFRTVGADYVEAVHAEGMEIYVYTVNDPEDMRAQIDNGVDGIISDYPDVLVKVITDAAR